LTKLTRCLQYSKKLCIENVVALRFFIRYVNFTFFIICNKFLFNILFFFVNDALNILFSSYSTFRILYFIKVELISESVLAFFVLIAFLSFLIFDIIFSLFLFNAWFRFRIFKILTLYFNNALYVWLSLHFKFLLLIITCFQVLRVFNIAFDIIKVEINCKKELSKIFAVLRSLYFSS